MKPVDSRPEDRLDAFSENQWQNVLAYGTCFECKAGEILHNQGELVDRHTLILSGQVSLTRTHNNETYRSGILRGRGETYSTSGFFMRQGRLMGATIDEDSTRIIVFERDDFFLMCSIEPSAMEFFFKDVSSMLYTAMDYVRQMREVPIETRVALRVLIVHETHGSVNQTQSEISAYLGLSRVTVSKALGDLADSGLIKRRYGRIVVLDEDGLRARVVPDTRNLR